MDEFCKVLQVSSSAKSELESVFRMLDANHDGTVDLDEFCAWLKDEPIPLLRRVYTSMSSQESELSVFDFFVGYYSICTMPHGDYIVRYLWSLYDTENEGTISEEIFRVMIRESLQQRQPFECVVRTDRDGHKHAAVVTELTEDSITVQDVYSLDNPMGLTQGDDHVFTYPASDAHVAEPFEGTPLPFDDKLEQFLVITADRNDDHQITLKEFRRLMRRRVSKGEPSPYAAMLRLQQKMRRMSSLTDEFWDHQSFELVVQIEKHGRLWNATELFLKLVLKQEIIRPPGDNPKKLRRVRFDGEEIIEDFFEKLAEREAQAAATTPFPSYSFSEIETAALAGQCDAEASDHHKIEEEERSKLRVKIVRAATVAAPALISVSRLFLKSKAGIRDDSKLFCDLYVDDELVVEICLAGRNGGQVEADFSFPKSKLEIQIRDENNDSPAGCVSISREQIENLCAKTEERINFCIDKVRGQRSKVTLSLELEKILVSLPMPQRVESPRAAVVPCEIEEHKEFDPRQSISSFRLPPVDEATWQTPKSCRCGRDGYVSSMDLFQHIVSCPTARADPDEFLIDIVSLSRVTCAS